MSDESPETFAEQGRLQLCDNPFIWYDKSMTFMSFKNGRIGVHCEHSWADALTTALIWEYSMIGECRGIGYDAEGYNNRPIRNGQKAPAHTFRKGREIKRLVWDFTSLDLQEAIRGAGLHAKEMRDDLELRVVRSTYGKNFMKKARVSPDAYIQLSFQIAYFRDAGRFQNTYEASQTRLFRDGRTETVRPVTKESCQFVRSFLEWYENPSEQKKKEVTAIFKKAADIHSLNNKNSMTGKGLDRHLFALYVVSVGRGVESTFLKQALSQKWVLSTSQQPQVQTVGLWDPFRNPEDNKRKGAGGGFGPVADDGYGVSYMLADDNSIFFHVSAKKSSPDTDGTRFSNHILKALEDLKKIFE
jgi:hypothetical protein